MAVYTVEQEAVVTAGQLRQLRAELEVAQIELGTEHTAALFHQDAARTWRMKYHTLAALCRLLIEDTGDDERAGFALDEIRRLVAR